MILVDIYVPAVDDTWDFVLDEEEPIRVLTEEIQVLLAEELERIEEQNRRADTDRDGKEQLPVSETGEIRNPVCLCSPEQGRILPPGSTLKKCGIRNGSRLLLC